MKRSVGLSIFVAVGIAIVGAFLYLEGQRREALGRVAKDLGFRFTGGQHVLPEHLDRAGFYLFTQGAPLIQNRMDGERAGYQVALFDFGYTAGKGEEGSRDFPTGDVGQVENRLQTLVWLRRAGQLLPDFDLSPTRQVLRRVGPRFGLRPLSLDGRADFHDRYQLLVRDDLAMRRVFSPSTIDALLADPGWFIEGRGDQWLVYRLSERVAPHQVSAFLDRAIGFIERLARPGYLHTD